MSSSVANFECFVTIDDVKHTICLNKDLGSVVFGDIYDQLRQLSASSADLCFDNNVFEVFDFEDNSYRRLTTIDTPIKYLSRIRVLPKNSGFVANNKLVNKNRNFNRRKDFESKFNPEMFNPELIDSNRVNRDFFNVELNQMSEMAIPEPKRRRYDFYGQREGRRNDQFFDEDLFPNRHFNYDRDSYGIADYEYQYSEPSMSSFRPYTRRSDLNPTNPNPYFPEPHNSSVPPYYRRRDEFNYMSPPEGSYPEYSPYNFPQRPTFRPMRYEPPVQPHPPNSMGFWPNFTQRMNSMSFPNRGQKLKNGGQRQKVPQMNSQSINKSFKESKEHLIANGFTISTKGQKNVFFCEFCEITIDESYVLAINHIKSGEHSKNSSEKVLDPLDKLLLIKPNNRSLDVNRGRRQQLRQMSVTDKRKFVRHGIRLKDGFGSQAYVCMKCSSSMSSLVGCHKHYDKFLQLNKSLNYPKDYHTLNDENNPPKVGLRYKRILNTLELTVDDNRSQEDEECLIELRDNAVVHKEETEEPKTIYFACLLCDKRIGSMTEAVDHIESDEHLNTRSPDRFKGLHKAFTIDSERCGQIEVDLARKQELEKMLPQIEESCFDHGIRLKNGIEPEAYVCITCNESYESLVSAKTHLDEYKRREESKRINESNEESLIDSAKRQMELLLNTDSEMKSKTEDFTQDVDDSSLICDFDEKLSKECIKEVVVNDRTKYHDILCDLHFTSKEQVVQHLSGSFHNRMKSGEFLKSVDKEFCCSSHRLNEPEVVSARLEVLQRLTDEAKRKFSEEGIRLKDGVGREAFWCVLCSEPILSMNIESSSMSFINHINYYPKHVELLIANNR